MSNSIEKIADEMESALLTCTAEQRLRWIRRLRALTAASGGGVRPCPFAVFDEFGNSADDRVWDYAKQQATAATPASPAAVDDGIVELRVTTRDPSNYILHNEDDGGYWRGTAEGWWARTYPPTPPAHGDGEGDLLDKHEGLWSDVWQFSNEYGSEAVEALIALRDFTERLARPTPEAQEAREKYDELIYAVASKWPGESRHETALRYIRERETVRASGAGAAMAVRGRGSDG